MNRFFVDKSKVIDDKYILIDSDEDLKHISKVLRLKEGDIIEVCDNDSIDYIGKIENIDKNNIRCIIVEKHLSQGEPDIDVVLFQGVPKSNKMDLIVQKCVELGIKKIIPVLTSRSVVKIKDRKSEDKKVDRWNKISLEAAKQCKRGKIPIVEEIIEFDELSKFINQFDLIIIPYENEEAVNLKSVIKEKKSAKKIGIIIGPEGGFEEEEIIKSKEWNCKSVTLGPRILRTETAGFVTSSIILYELGDLGGE